MATITRPRTGPPDPGENDFTKSLKFRTLIDQIKGRGMGKLNAKDLIYIRELDRQLIAQHDPRIRTHLQKASDEIHRAHLEFCLRLRSQSI
jgi:hypothetical protein